MTPSNITKGKKRKDNEKQSIKEQLSQVDHAKRISWGHAIGCKHGTASVEFAFFFLRRMQSNDVIPYNALIGDSSWRFELSQQSSGIVFFFCLPPSEDVRVALNLSRIANKQLSSCQPPNGRTFLSETHSSIRSINDVVERMLFLRRHSNFQTQPIFNY